MIKKRRETTTPDFDHFVSEVTAEIWNRIVLKPAFYGLRPAHFADVFGAVKKTLTKYHVEPQQGK